jgi:hypothetical protein
MNLTLRDMTDHDIESVLQIEDIIIHEGEDLWSNRIFSERWETLRAFWATLPPRHM